MSFCFECFRYIVTTLNFSLFLSLTLHLSRAKPVKPVERIVIAFSLFSVTKIQIWYRNLSAASKKPFELLCWELMIGFGDAHIIQCHTKSNQIKIVHNAGPRAEHFFSLSLPHLARAVLFSLQKK